MQKNDIYPGRLGVQQRVLPAYRAAFFDQLATCCSRGVSVFAGLPLEKEGIKPVERLDKAQLSMGRNRHLLDPSASLYLCWQSGLLRWLDDWQPDALIVEANPRYPLTRLAIRWMHTRGRVVFGWGLGAPGLSGKLAIMRGWERLSFLRSLDGVIAYSQRGAQEYRKLGVPEDRVFVAPNAVDPRPTSPPRLKTLSSNRVPCVLFIGRLQERKRVDLLFRACAAMPENKQPRLVIVGDGPARAGLEKLAQQVYPRAEFPGAKHGDELEPYFDQADLFVLPGTGGLAVQQAMAHGLPVIVAQGDGTQDDLVRPGNGWQIPPDDLPALQAALMEALDSPERLRQMGQEAYRIVYEEVNLENMAASFVQALNHISSVSRT